MLLQFGRICIAWRIEVFKWERFCLAEIFRFCKIASLGELGFKERGLYFLQKPKQQKLFNSME